MFTNSSKKSSKDFIKCSKNLNLNSIRIWKKMIPMFIISDLTTNALLKENTKNIMIQRILKRTLNLRKSLKNLHFLPPKSKLVLLLLIQIHNKPKLKPKKWSKNKLNKLNLNNNLWKLNKLNLLKKNLSNNKPLKLKQPLTRQMRKKDKLTSHLN